MYGLQQRKKTNKFGRSSVAPSADGNDDEVAADEAAKDEEYKLIYHQTFKGAALALVSLNANSDGTIAANIPPSASILQLNQ
jgi:hypothetical protein